MNWKDARKELPKIPEGLDRVRCLGLCKSIKYSGMGCVVWEGFVDIFYDPCIGWMRCEDKCEDKSSSVTVLKWVYWNEIDYDNKR